MRLHVKYTETQNEYVYSPQIQSTNGIQWNTAVFHGYAVLRCDLFTAKFLARCVGPSAGHSTSCTEPQTPDTSRQHLPLHLTSHHPCLRPQIFRSPSSDSSESESESHLAASCTYEADCSLPRRPMAIWPHGSKRACSQWRGQDDCAKPS